MEQSVSEPEYNDNGIDLLRFQASINESLDRFEESTKKVMETFEKHYKKLLDEESNSE